MRFRLIPAEDSSVDPEYAVETDSGIGTTLGIQDASSYGGGFVVNEYFYEQGCVAAVKSRGTYKTLASAKARARELYHARYITK